MTIASANVPTANAAKYLKQLCRHWSHRVAVDLHEDTGIVVFPDAVATVTAAPSALIVIVEAENQDTLDRLKRVVAGHLDRFAFREAPLRFDWS
jgi:uncharacterized protein